MSASGPTPSSAARASGDADVRFFELAGTGARAALEPLADACRRAGADVELLAAVDQDGLWLLVARGGGEPPSLHVPTGARVWRFRSAAP